MKWCDLQGKETCARLRAQERGLILKSHGFAVLKQVLRAVLNVTYRALHAILSELTMNSFSRALIELYEAAESVSIDVYPQEAVRLVRTLFGFDAAVLGVGDSIHSLVPDLLVDQAFVYKRDECVVADYGRISDQEAIARRLINGLSQPIYCSCQTFFRSAKLPLLEAFARRHELRQVMLYGTAAAATTPTRWIVLYRGGSQCFTKRESHGLLALWPHIQRSFIINRLHQLERHVRKREPRAAALVSSSGVIEAADPYFLELLAAEWPRFTRDRLPSNVLSCFYAGHHFLGSRIRISLNLQEDYIVCRAYEKDLLSALTPAELRVAEQFSRGLTHKDVAHQLGVSQNTVRTHIKHVYEKLEIHDKTRLAHLMATRFSQ